MSRSDKRYMVYPDPKTTALLGSSASILNAALDRWALLKRLMAAPEPVQAPIWALIGQMLAACEHPNGQK